MMQLDKVLRTMIRTKQEGKNDSYKAGFNDALTLLDQEEQHIVFEEEVYRTKDVEKAPHVSPHVSSTAEGEAVEKRMALLSQETTQALANLEDGCESSSLETVSFPHVQATPEPFTFNLQSQEQEEALYDKGGRERSVKEIKEETEVFQDKNSDKKDDKDIEAHPQDDRDEEVQLDEEELKKQRQLEALAEARRKAQEEDEDDE